MNILVTGIGCVSAIGLTVDDHLHSFREKRSGLGPVTLFQTRRQVPVAEVKRSNTGLKRDLGLPEKTVISRTSLLGMLAAREAYHDAGIEHSDKLRIGLISSNSTGGMDLSEHFYPVFRTDHTLGDIHDVVSHDPGDSTERIANFLGIDGFRTTISTACSSAANAIMLGARFIHQGILDVVIAGGTDALCKFTLNGFGSLMILDENPCRPFDETRAGLNLGEGAGFIVLQAETSTHKIPYCKLGGYANANDAFHQTASSPEGEGAYLAMKRALEKAGLKPEEVDYINAHGTGTPNNDASESAAIKRLFGSHIPPFSSTKAFTGHTLGAAGGIEAVFSILAIQKGMIFPNLNFNTPMVTTGLTPAVTCQEGVTIRSVLSNSFGFGGNNTSLLFQQFIP